MKKSDSKYNLSSRESISNLSKEELVDAVFLLGAKLQQLSDVVRDLVTAKHGQKTERFDSSGQLNIFPAPSTETAPSGNESPKGSKTSKKTEGHSRNEFAPELPRKKIYGNLPKDKSKCSCCNRDLQVIRQFLQGSRLQYIPASMHVEEMIGQVFACPDCSAEEVTVRVPEPVKNGIAAPGLLAQVAVSKGTDHLPFNRQSSIYARSGVKLHRSTLSDLFAHTASILGPLYDYMHRQVLKSKVIWTDDTPVKVKDPSKDKNIKTGRLWIYLGDKEHPFNLFDYTTGRGRDGPLTFLDGFNGFLQGDCFSGNLAVCAAMGTILVACLAHARRYFIKAMLNDKQGCNQALSIFQSLFEIERTAKELGLEAPTLKSMRQEESVPILNQFHEWLQEQYKFAQPQSSFGKALFYCLNNWTELCQYVTDGDLSIDNNVSEREMKYVAMGRKAWLFLGSDVGGKNHAIVLSLLSTCRRHGVEPWAYLTDVIERITAGTVENLEDLLPHKWTPRSQENTTAEIPAFQAPPEMAENEANSRMPENIRLLQNAV